MHRTPAVLAPRLTPGRHSKLAALQRRPDKPPAPQPHTFSHIENMLNQSQSHILELGSSCPCLICTSQNQEGNLTEEAGMTMNSKSYMNMFTLLQHLTMLEPTEAPRVLGELLIPMMFFRRVAKTGHGYSKCNQAKSGKDNYVFFHSNEKNDQLEHPRVIKSLKNVAMTLKFHQQRCRKHRFNSLQTQASALKPATPPRRLIHSKFFEQFLPAVMTSKPADKPRSIRQYILHRQDRYISAQSESYKMRQSEPFCIFRYQSKQGEDQCQYEIFTYERLKAYWEKMEHTQFHARTQTPTLKLVYIEGYVRMKSVNVSQLSKVLPSLRHRQISPSVPKFYFSEYKGESTSLACQIFDFCRLETKLRANKISSIDPCFLNDYQLQLRRQQILHSGTPDSPQRYQTMANYKLHRIVSVLEIVCRLRVDRLRLRWMLGESDELVLVECLDYVIDRSQCLQPRYNRDRELAFILDNGSDYLDENFNVDSIREISNTDVDDLLRFRLEELRNENSTREHNERRLSLKEQRHMKLRPIITEPCIPLKKSRVISSPSDYMSRNSSSVFAKQNSHFNEYLSSHKTAKNSYSRSTRKSYKLRPFKTEADSHTAQNL